MTIKCQTFFEWIEKRLKKFVRSEEIFRVSLIYLMYGQSSVCRKSICLHLENFIAFQTVIQELRTVCDDKKGAPPQVKCCTAAV